MRFITAASILALVLAAGSCQIPTSNDDLQAQGMCADAADSFNNEMADDRLGGLFIEVKHRWDASRRRCYVSVESRDPKDSLDDSFFLYDGMSRKLIERCFATMGSCNGKMGDLSYHDGVTDLKRMTE